MHQFRHTLLGAGLFGLLGCYSDAPPTGSHAELQAAEPEFPAHVSTVDGGAARDSGLAAEAGVRLNEAGLLIDLECPRGGNTGPVRVVFDCDEIIVITCKDLSNVVIEYDDGSRQRFQGLKGHQNAFGAPTGRTIVGVWVKAGENKSGDGPGYGERVDAPAGSCTDAGTSTPDSGTGRDAGSADTGTGNPPPVTPPPPVDEPPPDGPGLVD